MASGTYANLLLIFVIILLALEYSKAIDHEGKLRKRMWLKGGKTRNGLFLLHSNALDADGRNLFGGRKLLQGLNEKRSYISEQNEAQYDSEEWVEATVDEVANLMRNDYNKGANRARRKPPIHNQEPKN